VPNSQPILGTAERGDPKQGGGAYLRGKKGGRGTIISRDDLAPEHDTCWKRGGKGDRGKVGLAR